jgi:ATP-binding cassette subfamily B protein
MPIYLPENHTPATIRGVLREYWGSMRQVKWLYLCTILSFILGTLAASVITPLYFKKFFDVLGTAKEPSLAVPTLIGIVVSILVLNLGGLVFRRLGNYLDNYTYTKVSADLRQRSFANFIDHSYAFFSNNFTGSLTQRINRFARSFQNITDRLYYNIIPTIVRVVGIVIVLSVTYPVLAVTIGLWVIFLLISSYWSAQWKLKYSLLTAEADSRISASLSDAFSNHTTIQLFSGREHENDRFGKVVTEHAKLWQARWNVDMVIDTIQGFFSVIIQFVVFYLTIRYWGQGLVTIGMFVLAQAYIISLNDDLWTSSRVIRDMYESFADAKEAVEVIILPHSIQDAPGAKKIVVTSGTIDFRDVRFHFTAGTGVLDGIDLNIKAGERVALIGPSGAGKSTLVRLLMRLYDVQSGTILIDGQDTKKVTQDSLRKAVSFVPQDPILFHRSLKDNIKYGKLDATDDEVIAAAKLAHCHEFISGFPYGYDTYVGERGVKLSGGERQRVAIARAILKNAPILVLDEATSSLDSHSELLIQDALDALMKGKTVIVIAHRLSTIRKMNRIVVLDRGKITEEGSHDELLAKGGLYAHLWSLQSHGFIK